MHDWMTFAIQLLIFLTSVFVDVGFVACKEWRRSGFDESVYTRMVSSQPNHHSNFEGREGELAVVEGESERESETDMRGGAESIAGRLSN